MNKLELKLKLLITELKEENSDRSIAMKDNGCSDYIHTVLTHKHSNTLNIIKRLEAIIN